MKMMSKKMGKVIKALAEEQSYVGMCHADGAEMPMPSVERLRETL